jgi:hypothetical protein
MPVSDFLDLMPATVTFAHVTGRDGYGKASFGIAASYRARVVYKMIRTSNIFTGQDAVADGEVWLAGTVTPSDMDERITLPDGSTPKILNWEQFSDGDGPHHTVIHFGGTHYSGQR